jgi:DNA-binding IclR family transcriptional regulator
MVCLAAPVFDHLGKVVAAVGITTLTMFHTHDSMIEAYAEPVRAAGLRISGTLGYVNAPCPPAPQEPNRTKKAKKA